MNQQQLSEDAKQTERGTRSSAQAPVKAPQCCHVCLFREQICASFGKERVIRVVVAVRIKVMAQW